MQVQGASDGAKLNASMRLADAEIAVGDALAREVGRPRDQGRPHRRRDPGADGADPANNVAVAGYRGMDPKSAQQAIDEQKDAVAKGKENGLWIADGASPIPAQQTLATEIDRLNKEIADLQQKRAALETEQTQATQQADKLTEEGIKTKGQQALDMGIQAAELRKKSRDAGADGGAGPADQSRPAGPEDRPGPPGSGRRGAQGPGRAQGRTGRDVVAGQRPDEGRGGDEPEAARRGGGRQPRQHGASATPAAAPSADATAAGGGAAGANGARRRRSPSRRPTWRPLQSRTRSLRSSKTSPGRSPRPRTVAARRSTATAPPAGTRTRPRRPRRSWIRNWRNSSTTRRTERIPSGRRGSRRARPSPPTASPSGRH